MRNSRWAMVVWFVIVSAVLSAGCSKKDVRDEAVASVNGEDIKVSELREFLGIRGGVSPAGAVPVEKKKEALDRLVAGRLLAQEARAMGLDNTEEFRAVASRNEQGVWINALVRKQIASKVKVADSDVDAEAKKLREADKNLSEPDAKGRATQLVAERELRKFEEDLIATARKEFPVVVDNEAIRRIGKGESLKDNAVLATVGGEKVSYGEVKGVLSGMSPGAHGSQDLSRNPDAVAKVLDREAIGKSLYVYAKKQGLDGSEWLKSVRADMERGVLINLLAEKLAKGVSVTEQDIRAAYAEHGQMMVRDGKKIPLAQVKEQLRGFLENSKRRKILEERIEALRKKAKITVQETALPTV
ncbi:MAG: SurA N-terminal domain-containing protein [Deltaproteobacteria bacterium]|nr:SurA N-terminal domain-containing protein [Deltaproteobacteria bacterium]